MKGPKRRRIGSFANRRALQSDEAIDTTTPAGHMQMQIVGTCAEFERTVTRERTRVGLKAAAARGEKAVGMPSSTMSKKPISLTTRAPDGTLGLKWLVSTRSARQRSLAWWPRSGTNRRFKQQGDCPSRL
ncbi:recombinase family protein [Candidatus Entotheonella palauensis]|uniref:recombinase family protein n=1 Tax=Candidatus Entotheonella palauensis TaxID=93172 RepID=UPI0021182388|nr:recombinase family protein [Candidatus Entotheonella palauensis]